MTCSPPRAWVTDARDRRAGDSIASPRDECRPAAGAWTGFVSHLSHAASAAGKFKAWPGAPGGTGLAMQLTMVRRVLLLTVVASVALGGGLWTLRPTPCGRPIAYRVG